MNVLINSTVINVFNHSRFSSLNSASAYDEFGSDTAFYIDPIVKISRLKINLADYD